MSTISLGTFEQRVHERLESSDTSTEEFCRYAELCKDLLAALRESQATNRVIDAENEVFEARAERFADSLRDLLTNVGGHAHWDKQGTSGTNCPTCIRQREASRRARLLLEDMGSN